MLLLISYIEESIVPLTNKLKTKILCILLFYARLQPPKKQEKSSVAIKYHLLREKSPLQRAAGSEFTRNTIPTRPAVCCRWAVLTVWR